jgi:hypothetical protein
MKKATEPPYSPELACSHFHLFGHVNRCLAGDSFDHAGELLQAARVILNRIRKETFQAVFLNWMDQLRESIATRKTPLSKLTPRLWHIQLLFGQFEDAHPQAKHALYR